MGTTTRRVRLAVAALPVAALMAACAQASPSQPSPSPALTLSVDNRTTIAIALVVNGRPVTDIAAGATEDPVRVALPGLPWSVEARSPSGQTLLTLKVTPGNLGGATGGTERVRLSCGFLTLWAGTLLEGPVSVPASPPDCH